VYPFFTHLFGIYSSEFSKKEQADGEEFGFLIDEGEGGRRSEITRKVKKGEDCFSERKDKVKNLKMNLSLYF